MKVSVRSSAVAQRLAAMMIAAAFVAGAKPEAIDQQMLRDSATIIGRVGVAKMALAYGLKGEAQANIKSALDKTEALKMDAPKFTLEEPVTFGRIAYHAGAGDDESLIPFVNGLFSARLLDEKLLRTGSFATDVTDASVVKVAVTIDAPALKDDLLRAEKALKAGNVEGAVDALNAATGASLSLRQSDPGTLETAKDSLALAQQLLKDKDFRAAAFAAGHARDALTAAAEKDAALKARSAGTIRGLDTLGDTIRAGTLNNLKSPEEAAAALKMELEGLAPSGG